MLKTAKSPSKKSKYPSNLTDNHLQQQFLRAANSTYVPNHNAFAEIKCNFFKYNVIFLLQNWFCVHKLWDSYIL